MKTILLLLIGFAGAFVAVTHTDDVLAPDKPTIQNILPVNRTERALVLDARKHGLDYALSIVENRTGRVTDDKYWLLKDPHGGGYWGDYNSDPTNDGVKQYKTVAGCDNARESKTGVGVILSVGCLGFVRKRDFALTIKI